MNFLASLAIYLSLSAAARAAASVGPLRWRQRRAAASRLAVAPSFPPRGAAPCAARAPSPPAAGRATADLCVRRRPLRPSLAAKDRSGSRTAAVSECCKDSLWLATASTHADTASLRLRSHSNEHFYRLGFALADLAPPLRPCAFGLAEPATENERLNQGAKTPRAVLKMSITGLESSENPKVPSTSHTARGTQNNESAAGPTRPPATADAATHCAQGRRDAAL